MNRYLTGIALAFAGTFTMMAQAEPIKKETLEVQLLIYSGEPNPTFRISDEKEIKEILSMAENLPHKQLKAGETGLPEPKLGYQGFMVKNNTSTSPEIKSFVVHGQAVRLAIASDSTDGTVESHGNKVGHSARADAHNSLQGKLLAHAKDVGIANDQMIEAIENDK